jgi:CBS domain-containing protein
MTADVICACDESECREVANTLSRHRITGAPVLDKAGNLIGIVTEADLIFRQGEIVADIMTRDVFTVKEETPVEEVALILATRKIKRVPVLRAGKMVGIISRADIVRAMAIGEPLPLQTPIFDL